MALCGHQKLCQIWQREVGGRFFLSCSIPHFLYDLFHGLQCLVMSYHFNLAMGISNTCENWKCKYRFDHKHAPRVRPPTQNCSIQVLKNLTWNPFKQHIKCLKVLSSLLSTKFRKNTVWIVWKVSGFKTWYEYIAKLPIHPPTFMHKPQYMYCMWRLIQFLNNCSNSLLIYNHAFLQICIHCTEVYTIHKHVSWRGIQIKQLWLFNIVFASRSYTFY